MTATFSYKLKFSKSDSTSTGNQYRLSTLYCIGWCRLEVFDNYYIHACIYLIIYFVFNLVEQNKQISIIHGASHQKYWSPPHFQLSMHCFLGYWNKLFYSAYNNIYSVCLSSFSVYGKISRPFIFFFCCIFFYICCSMLHSACL